MLFFFAVVGFNERVVYETWATLEGIVLGYGDLITCTSAVPFFPLAPL